MSLPESVRKQKERSEELQKQLISNENGQEATENIDPPTQEVVTEPVVTPVPEVETTPAPEVKDPETDWEHKFKVLQGKYNKEVPRYAEQVREISRERERLGNDLKKLKDEVSELKKNRQPDLDPEAFGEYGEEFRKLVEQMNGLKAENESLKNVIEDLSEETHIIKESAKNLQDTQVNISVERFYESLGSAIPDWETVNQDPGFLRWLAEEDSLTGETKQALLDQAAKTLNSIKVIKIFKAYKNLANESMQRDREKADKRKKTLESQITPSKDQTDAGVTNDQKIFWTRDGISRFYADRTAGRISPEKAKSLEADLFLAYREGRIR
jgi:hypothetical protein